MKKLIFLLISYLVYLNPLTTFATGLEVEDPAHKVARSILMVDESYECLISKYKDCIEKGLPKINFETGKVNRNKVLIAGAGITGLLCGYLLQEAGFEVSIVEANQNRIGGRIKTYFNEPGKESVFKDPHVYAEAGAMRIPKSHPLINALISKFNLETQPFYNTDINPINKDKAYKTWIQGHGKKLRLDQFLDPNTPQGDRNLGFSIPEKYKNFTAEMLLNDAFKVVQDKLNVQLMPLASNLERRKSVPKSEIEKEVEAWAKIIKQYDGYSMKRFLEEHYSETDLKYFIGTYQNINSRLNLSFLHSFIDSFYLNSTTEFIELKGGNFKLPYAIESKLKNTIYMGYEAVEVQWADHIHPPTFENKNLKTHLEGNADVYLRTRMEHNKLKGNDFHSDYLIMSIPMVPLKRIVDHISPSFSNVKIDAIRYLTYDHATKVLLEFKKRFWEWKENEWEKNLPNTEYAGHGSIGGRTITDKLNRFTYFPSNHHDKSKGGVVLASYTWGSESQDLDSREKEDVAADALTGLKDIYGDIVEKYYTRKSKVMSWGKNPYAGGIAAVFTDGQAQEFFPHLSTVVGPIHFGGEHTSMKHAWIEGAIESAIRCCLEIINKTQANTGTYEQ